MAQTQATYDDANLILRLFELRRDEKLRKAREWFMNNFKASNTEEFDQLCPPKSEQLTYVRMVVSYWEMVASFITSGVLNEELFFQSGGELLFVWERIRELVPLTRERMKNPNIWSNLEKVGESYIKYLKAQGPEAYETWSNMVRALAAGAGR